jgi:uncharacterized protein (TIGR03663 family)
MDWTPWLIVGLAAFLRLLLLGIKPPHFDEGINGWFVDAHIIKQGFYRYDPTNYHGPLHFYVLFLFQSLFGRNLWALRLPVVIVSTLSVWLMLKYEPFVGRNLARIAAVAMAVSPGFVFYGRYSIHEAWLVLFSMLFILGLLGLWQNGSVNYLWCLALGATGMILTKETYFIHFACALLALLVFKISNILIARARISPKGARLQSQSWLSGLNQKIFSRFDLSPNVTAGEQKWDFVDLVAVAALSILLIVFFYSGTFFHWDGVKDIFRAYKPWFETGSSGHGHEKSWYYWLWLITRYELPILAGLLICPFCLLFKNFALRFLSIYSVGVLAAYSIVSYKTPWCIISIVWPFFLLFAALLLLAPARFSRAAYQVIAVAVLGILVVAIIGQVREHFDYAWPFDYVVGPALLLMALRSKETIRLLAGALLLFSLGSSIRLNYFKCTTDTEPYVYVQTYNDIWKLTRPMLYLAGRSPAFYQLSGNLIRTSSYPLPWLLGDFPNIGYYEHDTLPAKLDADVLLVQEDKIESIEPKLKESYFTEPLRIRPYQDTSKLYLNEKMFRQLFPNRTPDFVGTHQ